MPAFRLVLEYEGTDFAGWQANPGKRTVQGELESVLGGLAGRRVRATGAGRTDAGVHAAGQVVSASFPWKAGPAKLSSALNALLPRDIAVTAVNTAREGFNARRNAVSRTYAYTFLVSPARSPLRERFAFRVERPPRLAAMRRAVAAFRGTRDFSLFSRGGAGGTMRRLDSISLVRRGDKVVLEMTCRSFRRHMVRLVAAAVLAAGQGRLGMDELKGALSGRACRRLPPMLPARGLVLLGVKYR